MTTVHGALVTTAGRTIVDLARTVPFMDAVVVADAAVRARKTRGSELSGVIAACAGWPGLEQARRVVAFNDGRSGSPLESCARVVFDAFGLPPPELQAKIVSGVRVDAEGKVVVVDEFREYRVDFLWRDRKTVLTYVEMRWLEWGFEGQPVGDPWGDQRDERWHVAEGETLDSLVDALEAQARRSDAIISQHALGDRGQPGERWNGAPPATLERVLFHLLQEYARHLGHLDVVAELAGGPVGE